MSKSNNGSKKRKLRKWIRVVLTYHLLERLGERWGRGVPELWQLRGVQVELIRNHQGWELTLPGLGRLAGKWENGAFIACTYKYPCLNRCRRRHRRMVWIEDVVLNQGRYHAA